MVRGFARRAFDRIDAAFDAPFGARASPMRQLGGLAWWLFLIVSATGLYLYAAYDTSARGAHASVERIASDAWPLSALARSLHRYASDGLALVVALHLAREWARGRYAHAHRFAWLTGTALLVFVYASGISGFWLVWDRLAQFSLTATAEWLDALPLFGEPLARNFDDDAKVGDRLFSLLIFLHIGIPLAGLAAMGVHVKRLQRPGTQPPAALAYGTLAALVVLSLARPVTSDAPAALAVAPSQLALDWFYLAPHALQYATSPLAVWALAAVAFAALSLLPWAGRAARASREVPAVVTPASCNGCRRCVADCPFMAIEMVPRGGGEPPVARVDAALCTSCGICAGACPSSTPFRTVDELSTGIDLPRKPIGALRDALEREIARIAASLARGGAPTILVVGCDESAPVATLRDARTGALSSMCTAQLPPSFVDYALRSGVDGVLLTGCAEGDCRWRLGQEIVEERLDGRRAPRLRSGVPRERVRLRWAGPADVAALRAAIDAFRRELAGLPALPSMRPKRDLARPYHHAP